MTSGLYQGLSRIVNPCHLSVPETLHLPETCHGSLRKVKCVFIKCRRLCAPHVQLCNDDLMVETPLPFWGGKIWAVTFDERYKWFLEPVRFFTFTLKSSSANFLGSSNLSSKSESIFSIKSLSEAPFFFSVSSLPSLTRVFFFSGFIFLLFLYFSYHPLSLFSSS